MKKASIFIQIMIAFVSEVCWESDDFHRNTSNMVDKFKLSLTFGVCRWKVDRSCLEHCSTHSATISAIGKWRPLTWDPYYSTCSARWEFPRAIQLLDSLSLSMKSIGYHGTTSGRFSSQKKCSNILSTGAKGMEIKCRNIFTICKNYIDTRIQVTPNEEMQCPNSWAE